MAQIIPGVDQYLASGVQKLGDTLSLLTDTNRREQKAIREMLLKNPQMIQDYADLEARSPGSLDKLGIRGDVRKMIGDVPASMDVRREQRFGDQALDIEGQQLDLTQFRNNIIQAATTRDPTIDANQLDALVSNFLGIPTQNELREQALRLPAAALGAKISERELERLAKASGINQDMFNTAHQFISGVADPNVMQAVFSDPNLKAQFGEALSIIEAREGREARTGNVPVSIQNQLMEIKTVKPVLERYSSLIDEWFKLPANRRLGIAQGKFIGSPDEQALYGAIRAVRQQIAGRLRLAIIGPGAVSDQERRMLLQSIGDPLSIDSLIRGPEAPQAALAQLRQTVLDVEQTLTNEIQSGMSSIRPGGVGTGAGTDNITRESVIRELLQRNPNATNAEIIAELQRRGIDTGRQ